VLPRSRGCRHRTREPVGSTRPLSREAGTGASRQALGGRAHQLLAQRLQPLRRCTGQRRCGVDAYSTLPQPSSPSVLSREPPVAPPLGQPTPAHPTHPMTHWRTPDATGSPTMSTATTPWWPLTAAGADVVVVPYLPGFGPTRSVTPLRPVRDSKRQWPMTCSRSSTRWRRLPPCSPSSTGVDGGRAACLVAALWSHRVLGE